MKHRTNNTILTLALCLGLMQAAPPIFASGGVTPARITTLVIDPNQVTVLHLRPGFESAIHLPEDVSSVLLGNPAAFKAEHSEGEPEYVYVKPIIETPSQSNLLIALQSGQHVTLELVSDGGSAADAVPVDFLLQYKQSPGFVVTEVAANAPTLAPRASRSRSVEINLLSGAGDGAPPSALALEYRQQRKINAPVWTRWEHKQIETSVGVVRQWDNQIAVSFSVLNCSSRAVEIVPPQIQLAGLRLKKKKKKGKDVTADQLEIRDYRLSATRLEPGARADGVVLFDRPNYKQASQQLYLQIAEANKIDQPILVRLPFTPPIAGSAR